MKTFCSLYIASDVAPLTGSGAIAKEVHSLCRAMAEAGVELTLAIPGRRLADPAGSGLARRLDTVRIAAAASGAGDAFEATVHEGKLADGRVKVLAIDLPSSVPEDGAREAFCRAVVTLVAASGAVPSLVCVEPETAPALAMAKAQLRRGERAPVTLLALRDGDAAAKVLDADTLALADHLMLPSAAAAKAWRAGSVADGFAELLAAANERREGEAIGITGSVGGIDAVSWSPAKSGLDLSALSASKAEHKRALKRELGVGGGAGAPLMALIGPFSDEMLSDEVVAQLAAEDVLLVVLALSERDRELAARFDTAMRRGRGAVQVVDDEAAFAAFERKLLCAADLALFGRAHGASALSELHCLRYGVAPVAPRQGGFADLLVDFDARTTTGSGFLFDPAAAGPAAEGGLLAAVRRALRAYHQPQAFVALRERAAHFDLGWRAAARRYADLIPVPSRARPAGAETPAAGASVPASAAEAPSAP